MNVIGSGTRVSPWSPAVVALVVLAGANAAGCKTGTAGMKPTWWTFGGGPKPEAPGLASAPSFDGSIEKPSAAAKPYPVTSTPNGYVLEDGARTRPEAAVAAASPVTYGVTPPPAKAEPAVVAAAPDAVAGRAGGAAGGSLAGIAPQVGPYAALPTEQPAAGANPPPLQHIAAPPSPAPDAAAFGASSLAAAAAAEPPASPRVADARGGWASQPAPVATGGNRYDSAAVSRFGGAGPAEQPPASPPAVPPSSGLPDAAAAALEPFPVPPPATPAAASQPAAFPPPPSSGVLPPAAPTAPPRRPDPGYRPGGTSSYRPNRAILAAEPPATDAGGVRPVGFDAPAAVAP